MTSFDELQSLFVSTEFAAFGVSSGDGRVIQPATGPPIDNDSALWSWFNRIPEASSPYQPSSSEFFAAYGEVIESLIAGASPLDPIKVAKKKLAKWGSAPPAWNDGGISLAAQLAAAPATSFPFRSKATPPTGLWGLWADSSPVSGPAARFAAGEVDMSLSFPHLLNFAPSPDDWYVSSALSMAYANPGKRPWDPDSPITWDTAFGPGGTLRHFLTSLLVADELVLTYTSSTPFDAEDQALIQGHLASGLWPYYLNAASGVTTVSFDDDGRLTVTITGARGHPVALAATVVSAGRYLGH
jgi:hypothetical protein